MKTTYNEYLISTINNILESYDVNKNKERLEDMITEINTTEDSVRLNNIAEELDYLICVIKQKTTTNSSNRA